MQAPNTVPEEIRLFAIRSLGGLERSVSLFYRKWMTFCIRLHYWNAIVIGFDSVSIVSWCKRGWIHEAFLNSVLNRILWISTNIIWLRNLRLAPISKEAVSVNDQLLEAARLMMIIRTLQFCNAALLILLKCSVLLQYYLCRKHINVSSQSQSVKLTASVCITSIHGTALEGRCWLCKLKVDAV